MREEKVTLENKGMRMIGKLAVPTAPPVACVVLFHGFTGCKDESGNLFVNTSKALVELGMACLRFDFRFSKTDTNASESEGRIEQMMASEWISDARVILSESRKRFPGVRVGAIGLSMGGLVAVNVASEGLLDALVTWSAPADIAAVTVDSKVVDRVQSTMGERFEAFVQDTMKHNPINVASSMKITYLAVAGELDAMVPSSEARKLFDAAKGKKSMYVIGGADHVFSEHQREAIDISAAWLRSMLID